MTPTLHPVDGPAPGTSTTSTSSTAGPGRAAADEPLWLPHERLVADVRHALAHAPRDTPEARFEAWAWRALLDETGPALLTRHAVPSHVTASAVVVSADGRRTCLVLHGRVNLWVQPGGHLDEDDTTLARAAAREAQEETGLTGVVLPQVAALSRHRAPCRPEVDWHLDVQHVLVAQDTTPTVSAESTDVRWWDVDALPAELAPGVTENLARALHLLAAHR